jgi:hypothetical protein
MRANTGHQNALGIDIVELTAFLAKDFVLDLDSTERSLQHDKALHL